MKKLSAASLVAAAALTLGIVTSGSAYAGTNGQQIETCSSDPTIYYSVIIGSNEKGNQEISPFLSLNSNDDTCHWFYKWWWKGDVQINWYDSGKNYKFSTHCNVPVSLPQDVYECNSNGSSQPA